MSKPRNEVKETSYYKDIYFLYDALNTLRNIDEVKLFMKDMLTKSELRMLKRRWHIANLLLQGNNVRDVAIKAKVSTQTVMKLKLVLEEGYGGLRLAIERVTAKQKKESKKKIVRDYSGGRGSSKFVKNWFKQLMYFKFYVSVY